MNKIGLIVLSAGLFLLVAQCENPTTADADMAPASLDETAFGKTTTTHFTGTEDHSITAQDAQQMMNNFRADNPFQAYGWYFGREAYEYLLANPEAVGIRIYGGRKADGSFSPVIIGVDSNGKDLIKSLQKSSSDPLDNGLREKAFPCPPDC